MTVSEKCGLAGAKTTEAFMADKPVDTVAQREMWDEWWYDQFEIPNDIPDNFRRFEIEIDGEVCVGALLETAAPKTCEAFWQMMPIDAYIIHCAFFGHAAFYLDRVDMVPALGYELENRQTRMAPGDFIWDPWLKEVTFAYGRHAGMRFPHHALVRRHAAPKPGLHLRTDRREPRRLRPPLQEPPLRGDQENGDPPSELTRRPLRQASTAPLASRRVGGVPGSRRSRSTRRR